MRDAPNLRVATLAYDGLCTFEFGIAVEIFGLKRPELGDDWYEFVVAGVRSGPVSAAGGVVVVVDRGLRSLGSAGTIVVPGWRDHYEPPPEELVRALRSAHDRGARLISICSGAFLLAAAGLLDGKRATTHWRYADELGRMYPSVHVDPDVLYVDEGSVMTSAGSAAGIDACLHLVRHDHGADIANQVARRLVVPPHRDGGQAQFVPRPLPSNPDDGIAPVMDWAARNLDTRMSVETLAAKAMMAPRTFCRRFSEQIGTSPHRWLVGQRLHLCQDLLQTTNLPIDAVADAAGFGTAATMRHHFAQAYDTTPSAFRRRFSPQ